MGLVCILQAALPVVPVHENNTGKWSFPQRHKQCRSHMAPWNTLKGELPHSMGFKFCRFTVSAVKVKCMIDLDFKLVFECFKNLFTPLCPFLRRLRQLITPKPLCSFYFQFGNDLPPEWLSPNFWKHDNISFFCARISWCLIALRFSFQHFF